MVFNGFAFVFANEVPDDLKRVVNKGYFGQGGLRLEDLATRGEFAVIALRLQGFSDEEVKEANIVADFVDVDETAWYAPFIGYAVQEGLFEGDSNAKTFRPKNTITYTEMLVVLMRALGYSDDLKDPSLQWPTDHLKMASEVGLKVDSNISPFDHVTRGMVAYGMENALDISVKDSEMLLLEVLEEKAKDLHIIKAGHYIGEEGRELDGNVYIKSGDVTLENYTINGDLIITEVVGEGEVYLKNITVMGDTHINGGGENSIYMYNAILRKVTIKKLASPVRLVTSDGTKIQDIIVETAAKLENASEDSEIETVIIAENLTKDTIVEVKGSFKAVDVKASDIDVNLTQAIVEAMKVHESAKGSRVNISEDSTVASAVVDVEIKFTGQGTLEKVKVNVVGVTFEKSPVKKESTVQPEVIYYPPATGGSGNGTPVDHGTPNDGTVDNGTVIDTGLDEQGRPILKEINLIFSPAILVRFEEAPATLPTAADFIVTRSQNGIKDESFDGVKVFSKHNWISHTNTLQITRTIEGILPITEHYEYHVEVLNNNFEHLIKEVTYNSNVSIYASYVKAIDTIQLSPDLDLYRTINGVVDTKFNEPTLYTGLPSWRDYSDIFGGKLNISFLSEIRPLAFDQEVIYYLGYKGQTNEEYLTTMPFTVHKIQNLLLDVKDETIVVGAEVDNLVKVNIADAQVTLVTQTPDIVSIDETTRKISGLKSGVVEIVATASREGYQDVVKSFFVTVINEGEVEIIEERETLSTKLQFVHQQVGYSRLSPSDIDVTRTINGVLDDSFQWDNRSITLWSYSMNGETVTLDVNIPYVEGAQYTANLKPQALEMGFVLSEFKVLNEDKLEVYLSAVPASSTIMNFTPIRYVNGVQDNYFALISAQASFTSNTKKITFWNLPYESGVSYKSHLKSFMIDRFELEATITSTTGSSITVPTNQGINVKVGDKLAINPKVYNSENAIMENAVFGIDVFGEGKEAVINHHNGTFTFIGAADVDISIRLMNGKTNGMIKLDVTVEP